jgi:Leucine-rich repeat (LRR) protein
MDSVTIADKVPDLGNLKALLALNLSKNALFGAVPEGLVNHPTLRNLDLSSNKLTGDVPVGQKNSSLSIVDFSDNKLNLTQVNMSSVHYLNLSSNKYAGKGEELHVKLSSDGAVVDLRGNPFQCSYPGFFCCNVLC